MALPRIFCWTRFGTEAGEAIAQVLARKERERVLNDAVFLWGIGNAIGPSIRQLVRLETNPAVIFSPIRSAPRKEDVTPDQIVVWTAGRTVDGQRYELPAGSIVTSRFTIGARSTSHYALVCASPAALQIDPEGETIVFGKLRNLKTNRPIGASQVTAIVRRADHDLGPPGLSYPAAIRSQLIFPYFVKLLDPVLVPKGLYGGASAEKDKSVSLIDFVRQCRSESRLRPSGPMDLNPYF